MGQREDHMLMSARQEPCPLQGQPAFSLAETRIGDRSDDGTSLTTRETWPSGHAWI